MRAHSVLAVLAVIVLIGIGLALAYIARPGSKTYVSSRGPERLNACDMLEAADVERVIGVPVRTAERRDDGMTKDGAYSSTCFWGTTEVPEMGGTYAILNAMAWPAGSGGGKHFLEEFYHAADAHVIPSQPEPLSYGDESLYWGDGVAVLVGDISFGISVRHSSPDRSIRRIMEEMLAKKILENL